MSFMTSLKKNALLTTAVALSVVAVPAMAEGPDYTAIVAGLDFASVVTGIMAVATAIAGVYVAVRGSKMLIGFLRSA